MSETFIRVEESSTGKQLKTWTGSNNRHAEAMVLSLPDATGTIIDPRLIIISGSTVTLPISGSIGFTTPVGITGSIDPITGSINNWPSTTAVTQSGAWTVTGSINNPVTGSINNFPSVYPSTQSGNWSVGTSGSWKDSISSGATIITLTAQSGSKLINASGTKKIKLFDVGMSPQSAGIHMFYFGTTTGSVQTRRILTCSGSGTFRQTFVYPRVSNASDALYVLSTLNETSLAVDFSYVQE